MPANVHSARIDVRDGRTRLLVDGRPVAPLWYGLTDCPGARWTWEEVPARQLRLFAEAGIRLFQVDLWFEHLVDERDGFSLDLARRQVAGVLAQCADAVVMLRLHVNAPTWWCRAHAEACIGYTDAETEDTGLRWGMLRPLTGDEDRPLRASYASPVWRSWADGILARFCREFSVTPEGAAVASLQIANGVYGEWHQFGFLMHDPDCGPAATAAFRAWLGDPAACVPSSWDREQADAGILRDPRTRQRVIDYFTWQHECLADTVTGLCQVAKANWPRDLLTASFFGYFHSMFGRQAAGGHLSLARVLASPHLDALCAPTSYTKGAREIGGPGQPRGLPDAVRRAGKLWLDEMDQPTAVGSPWNKDFRSTVADDVAVMRRNILHPVTRGGGAWWYDFGPVSGCDWALNGGTRGWWDNRRLLDEVAAICRVVEERVERPFHRAADVLVVHDPWSFRHTVSHRLTPQACADLLIKPRWSGDPLSHLAIDDLTEALHRSGVIHADCLVHELERIDLSAFKVVVFATTPVFDAAQRRIIAERVRGGGRQLWCLGFCGWSDGKRLGADLFTEVTGLDAELATAQHISADVHGLAFRRSLWEPLAVPAATNGEPLARWESGGVAAAWSRDALGVRAWWGVPPTEPALLRTLLREAGCHVINEQDDATMLGGGLLLVHSVPGGSRRLAIPGGPVVQVELPPRSTVVIDAETGAVLLG